MKKVKKFIPLEEKQPINNVGEAHLIDGTFWIIEEEEETNEEKIIRLLEIIETNTRK